MSHNADWTMSYKEPSSYVLDKFDDLSVTINYGNDQTGASFPLV